jgi:hypothetical protein
MNKLHLVAGLVLLIILIIAYYLFLAPINVDLSNTTQTDLVIWTQMSGPGQRCLYKKLSSGVLAGPAGTLSDGTTATPFLLIYKDSVTTTTSATAPATVYYYGLIMYAADYNTLMALITANGTYYENGSFGSIFYGNGIVSLNPASQPHVNMHFIERLGLCSAIVAGTNVQNTAAMGPTSTALTATAGNKLKYGLGNLTIAY